MRPQPPCGPSCSGPGGKVNLPFASVNPCPLQEQLFLQNSSGTSPCPAAPWGLEGVAITTPTPLSRRCGPPAVRHHHHLHNHCPGCHWNHIQVLVSGVWANGGYHWAGVYRRTVGFGPICPRGAGLVLQSLARFGTWPRWALMLSVAGSIPQTSLSSRAGAYLFTSSLALSEAGTVIRNAGVTRGSRAVGGSRTASSPSQTSPPPPSASWGPTETPWPPHLRQSSPGKARRVQRNWVAMGRMQPSSSTGEWPVSWGRRGWQGTGGWAHGGRAKVMLVSGGGGLGQCKH